MHRFAVCNRRFERCVYISNSSLAKSRACFCTYVLVCTRAVFRLRNCKSFLLLFFLFLGGDTLAPLANSTMTMAKTMRQLDLARDNRRTFSLLP